MHALRLIVSAAIAALALGACADDTVDEGTTSLAPTYERVTGVDVEARPVEPLALVLPPRGLALRVVDPVRADAPVESATVALVIDGHGPQIATTDAAGLVVFDPTGWTEEPADLYISKEGYALGAFLRVGRQALAGPDLFAPRPVALSPLAPPDDDVILYGEAKGMLSNDHALIVSSDSGREPSESQGASWALCAPCATAFHWVALELGSAPAGVGRAIEGRERWLYQAAAGDCGRLDSDAHALLDFDAGAIPITRAKVAFPGVRLSDRGPLGAAAQPYARVLGACDSALTLGVSEHLTVSPLSGRALGTIAWALPECAAAPATRYGWRDPETGARSEVTVPGAPRFGSQDLSFLAPARLPRAPLGGFASTDVVTWSGAAGAWTVVSFIDDTARPSASTSGRPATGVGQVVLPPGEEQLDLAGLPASLFDGRRWLIVSQVDCGGAGFDPNCTWQRLSTSGPRAVQPRLQPRFNDDRAWLRLAKTR